MEQDSLSLKELMCTSELQMMSQSGKTMGGSAKRFLSAILLGSKAGTSPTMETIILLLK